MIDFVQWQKSWDGRAHSARAILAECRQHHPARVCAAAWNFAAGRIPPESEPSPKPEVQSQKSGPGTELKRLLASLGIHPKGCGCDEFAREMDRMGPDWCEANLIQIEVRILEQSKKRGWLLRNLPLLPSAARALIRLAIAKARAATRP